MRASARRRPRGRTVVVGAATILLLGLSGTVAPGAQATVVALSAPIAAALPVTLTAGVPPVGGVDVDAVVEALTTSDVVLVGNTGYAVSDFQPVIDSADDSTIDVRIVVLAEEPVGASATEVAAAVVGADRGTVLVLTPTSVGIASDAAGQDTVGDAIAAADQFHNRVQAAEAAVRELAGDEFDWSLVVVGGIAVLVLAGVFGGVWGRRRHRAERGAAITELGAGLATELGEVRAAFDELGAQAGRTDRQDLADRAEDCLAECDRLAGRLADPTRGDIDDAADDLDDLRRDRRELADALESVGPTPDER